MSKIIGIAGKGGTGKTTLAGLVIKWLVKEKKMPILAIDADPNANLAQKLGVAENKGIVELVDEFSREKGELPSGIAKDRFLEYKLQELINEADGFDLLVMGKPEGPGCYCYINNVLRTIVEKMTKSYNYTAIDNEAGMEHLSRRTARQIDLLFIVSDETPVGIRSAKKIYDLTKELDIKTGKAYLIINRSRGRIEEISSEIKKTGLVLGGIIPEDDELYRLSVQNRPVTELKDGSMAKKAIEGICRTTINLI